MVAGGSYGSSCNEDLAIWLLFVSDSLVNSLVVSYPHKCAVLSDEQVSNQSAFSSLNDEQMVATRWGWFAPTRKSYLSYTRWAPDPVIARVKL